MLMAWSLDRLAPQADQSHQSRRSNEKVQCSFLRSVVVLKARACENRAQRREQHVHPDTDLRIFLRSRRLGTLAALRAATAHDVPDMTRFDTLLSGAAFVLILIGFGQVLRLLRVVGRVERYRRARRCRRQRST
jgi:hypothetical protein